jgi:eukaryotic-like serine/threonine-protein kinase
MSLLTIASVGSGDLLDHYRLEHLVATGGMASVFRATDTETGFPVALKIPHPHNLADRHATERFLREIEIGTKFDHPSLVKVLRNDCASSRYAVMEWVDGHLLRAIIAERGSLTVERSARIAFAICDALDYIHRHGVVHNDLKPDNVMVSAEDDIKLMDFGLARGSKVSLWNRSKRRNTMGTPDYASPEQIRVKPSDARSDIFSLGVMLFEMLTGEVPFSGLDPDTAMQMRLRVDPPTIREIDPNLPTQLELIVSRALARDRAERYSSARELAIDLSGFQEQETAKWSTESIAQF